MRLLVRLIGLILILLGVYFLGENIHFTTNPYPFWWRGIAADASILFLTLGVLMLFALPSQDKSLAFAAIAVGIILIFFSSQAILNPTSLWQFFYSLVSFVSGYQLLTTGRLNI
ncbi:MAG: hypothetical protein AB4206_21455 [Xenococcaceae cyanobacterium]